MYIIGICSKSNKPKDKYKSFEICQIRDIVIPMTLGLTQSTVIASPSQVLARFLPRVDLVVLHKVDPHSHVRD